LRDVLLAASPGWRQLALGKSQRRRLLPILRLNRNGNRQIAVLIPRDVQAAGQVLSAMGVAVEAECR
jgi:hypothetical protein